jgi:hypothetical protein
MTLPRQWTSSGVGSAIPASVLGAAASVTAATVGIITNITENPSGETTTYYSAVDTPATTLSSSDSNPQITSVTTNSGKTVPTTTQTTSDPSRTASSHFSQNSGVTSTAAPSESVAGSALFKGNIALAVAVAIIGHFLLCCFIEMTKLAIEKRNVRYLSHRYHPRYTATMSIFSGNITLKAAHFFPFCVFHE